jgi:hypothetical protein
MESNPLQTQIPSDEYRGITPLQAPDASFDQPQEAQVSYR